MAKSEKLLLETRLFSVVEHRYQTPDGRPLVRQTVQHPGAVTIVPMVDDDHVCLIRNYRIAVDETLIELPAGTLEPNEDPRKTAERELTEETGHVCRSIRGLTDFNMSPGIINERMFLYLATGLTPGPPAREPGEEIENLVVAWDEAMTMVADGRIKDAKSLVGLLYVDRFCR